ncbi:hypothetical protein Fcan01_10979 [Folsomia candida]|uniref:Uncharacterized protein n=1 Tax=Folsomia candida TaxID=158441 RepID=A0A226E8W0_FOLCA|nr:hypothetical protein Fcan01_10979 [Folsomia candida]
MHLYFGSHFQKILQLLLLFPIWVITIYETANSTCQNHIYYYPVPSQASNLLLISKFLSDRTNLFPVTISPHTKNNASLNTNKNLILPYRKLLGFSKILCNAFLLLNPSEIDSTSDFISKTTFDSSETVIFAVILTHSDSRENYVSSWNEMDFPAHTVPLLLITFTTAEEEGTPEKFTISILCYTCPQRFVPLLFSTGATLENVLSTHRSLNWVGRGVMAYTKCYTILDPTLPPLTQFPRLLTCETNFDSEDRCIDMYVLWSILQVHLNFTIAQTDDTYDSGLTEPSLKICMECIFGAEAALEPVEFHSIPFYSDDKDMHFIYCEDARNLKQPNFLFILEPFDTFVWIGIVLVGLLLSLMWRDFSYFLHVWFVLMNQPVKGAKFCAVPSLLIFILATLTHQYQGIMTTNFIAKPKQHYISTIKEMYSSGYRFTLPNPTMAPFAGEVARKEAVTFGWNLSDMFVYRESINQFDSFPNPSWYPVLAEIKGVVLTYSELNKYVGKGGMDNQGYNVSCHIIEERFKEIQHVWMMRSYLSARLVQVLNFLHEGDIDLFWYRRMIRKAFFKNNVGPKVRKVKGGENLEEMQSSHVDNFDVQPISLNSSVKILLYYYWIGVFCSYCGFCWENFGVRIVH